MCVCGRVSEYVWVYVCARVCVCVFVCHTHTNVCVCVFVCHTHTNTYTDAKRPTWEPSRMSARAVRGEIGWGERREERVEEREERRERLA